MAFCIERACPDDAPDLTDCIIAAYANYVSQGVDLPAVSEGVADDIAQDTVWVARENGTVVGAMILFVDVPDAYLKNIAVHPNHAGRGVARQLLDTARAIALAAGCGVIKLTTHVDTPANVAMYQHLGWRISATEGVKVAMDRNLAKD